MTSTLAVSAISKALPMLELQRQRAIDWRLIVSQNGRYVMHLLQFHSTQTGTTALHILNSKYHNVKPKIPWYHGHSLLEDAIISPVSSGADICN